MISYTLENLKLLNKSNDTLWKESADNLYNIFRQTYIDYDKIGLSETIVRETEEMRLDRVSHRIYGSTGFIEELMQINNIINIWNIKQGDVILFSQISSLEFLKSLEKELDNVINQVATPNKETRIDPERNVAVPPTIRPKSLETLTIDYKTKKIKINGKLS